MGEANIALVVNRNLADFLGIAIVGGLILSQLLTLYTTMVVYIYLDRFNLWLRLRRGRRPMHGMPDVTLAPGSEAGVPPPATKSSDCCKPGSAGAIGSYGRVSWRRMLAAARSAM